jgi:hypothetical protein
MGGGHIPSPVLLVKVVISTSFFLGLLIYKRREGIGTSVSDLLIETTTIHVPVWESSIAEGCRERDIIVRCR